MKKNLSITGWLALAALAVFSLTASTAFAQGTAFTYQGRLDANGSTVNGLYDLRFEGWDALSNGNMVAGPVTNSATVVSNGLFTVTLDFGNGVFTGSNRWLEIAVRTNGTTGFVALAPRQPLTPAPYAIAAGNAIVEAARAQSAESTLTANLNNEITRAESAESTLNVNLNSEVAARKQGDADTLSAAHSYSDTGIASEAARAESAEATLSVNLNNEVTRAISAEGALGTGLANEVAARTNALNGLLIRRVSSLNYSTNQVVARTDTLTLERDGTFAGLLIRYVAGAGRITINSTGVNNAGTSIPVHVAMPSPGSPGTVQLYTDAQHMVHVEISFGNTFNNLQITQVVLDRYDDGITSDFYWVGAVTSSYNQ